MILNLDAGERDDETASLWAQFDLLNCACGGHAGDARSMERVAAFCAHSGVQLGAHPSYPDREGFGRRSLSIDAAVLTTTVSDQCRNLAEAAARHGAVVSAVKPHGALYHDAAAHPAIAAAFLGGAVAALGRALLVIGPPRGALRDEAGRLGLSYAREGFADRRMRADGSLVPRSEPGALIVDPDQAARQAAALAADVDTLCLHADTPGALEIASAVREAIRG